MMETLEGLASRLRTTEEIRSIVRTMKSLSSANIRQYETAVEAVAGYDQVITLGLQAVLQDRKGLFGDLRAGAGTGPREALVVIGSDRGLCGPFNDKVSAFAHVALEEDAGRTGRAPLLCVLGVRTAARLEAAGHRPGSLFGLPGSVAGLVRTVQSVAIEIERMTAQDAVGRVCLIYNRRTAGSLSEPTREALLPLSRDELNSLATSVWPSRSLPMYRMDRGALLSWLIGQRLFVRLYRALAESLASEYASRLAAMQRAERNIDDRREMLMAEYRRTRQETITRELLDVIAGYESSRSRHAPS